jgi:2-polyprenyl-3-methyl-5-hydroxy-6-metoxy-1,4-benzoquinol methylase
MLEMNPEAQRRLPVQEIEGGPVREAIVQEYFQSAAGYWKSVYREDDVSARIYQERLLAALEWINGLHLKPGAAVMDVGCGAGVATVALAERGLSVTAVDLAPAMLDLTSSLARQRGVEASVHTQLSSVDALPFKAGSFDCVMALGLLPWVEDPAATIAELARVVRPGGHLLISADNYWRVDHFFDPIRNPLLRPLRQGLTTLLRMTRHRKEGHATAKTHRPSEIDHWTRVCKLETVRSTTMGFGPFALFKVPVLTQSFAIKTHEKLQERADLGKSPWRHCGRQYLQLSRKPE